MFDAWLVFKINSHRNTHTQTFKTNRIFWKIHLLPRMFDCLKDMDFRTNYKRNLNDSHKLGLVFFMVKTCWIPRGNLKETSILFPSKTKEQTYLWKRLLKGRSMFWFRLSKGNITSHSKGRVKAGWRITVLPWEFEWECGNSQNIEKERKIGKQIHLRALNPMETGWTDSSCMHAYYDSRAADDEEEEGNDENDDDMS